jgi:hypothetical protein
MIEKNDWRLTNQERYLRGLTFSWKKYTRYSESWDHDHCEFCLAKFMENEGTDILTEGYTTSDNYRWICKTCFDDFKDMFQFKVTE